MDTPLLNLYARRWTPASGWSLSQLIETNDAGDVHAPRIALDNAGNGFAIWDQKEGANRNEWVNRFTIGAGWGTAQLLEQDNEGEARDGSLAVDATGNAMAVWSHSNGPTSNIQSARYDSASGWKAPVLVELSDSPFATFPNIGMTLTGKATVVWMQSDGSYYNIWANQFN
jgi:hypothetical protein